MADRRIDPRAAHAAHDEEALAAFAAGELDPGAGEPIARQVAGCPACASLVGDLRLLRSATRDLPAPSRRRDFRLSPADAHRLGRQARWHRLLGPFGAAGAQALRPVAGGLVALGLVGILLTAVGPAVLRALPGAASSAGQDRYLSLRAAGEGSTGQSGPSRQSLPPLAYGPGGASQSGAPRTAEPAGASIPAPSAIPVPTEQRTSSDASKGAAAGESVPSGPSGPSGAWVLASLSVAALVLGLALLAVLRLAARWGPSRS